MCCPLQGAQIDQQDDDGVGNVEEVVDPKDGFDERTDRGN